ncbi:uncharacterized protein BDZ83DRAFT_645941 [Colletotrichum acutatum]|uniref:Uncharacterized protein n=1 Tax=Glomerella acutata TaxID=27357 RepID=A0AAD9D390_GLOAC|nr:uncharacterized protein BDZ83DRAFT_645941 [Colletotrichum acutatum]KAK1731425.1 hypothetical protein BDZ83DRAFT_645941 [Colletotrichum acutatum]
MAHACDTQRPNGLSSQDLETLKPPRLTSSNRRRIQEHPQGPKCSPGGRGNARHVTTFDSEYHYNTRRRPLVSTICAGQPDNLQSTDAVVTSDNYLSEYTTDRCPVQRIGRPAESVLLKTQDCGGTVAPHYRPISNLLAHLPNHVWRFNASPPTLSMISCGSSGTTPGILGASDSDPPLIFFPLSSVRV